MRHILDLMRNIISLGDLDLKKYEYTSEGRVLKQNKGAFVVMNGQRRLFQLYIL